MPSRVSPFHKLSYHQLSLETGLITKLLRTLDQACQLPKKDAGATSKACETCKKESMNSDVSDFF